MTINAMQTVGTDDVTFKHCTPIKCRKQKGQYLLFLGASLCISPLWAHTPLDLSPVPKSWSGLYLGAHFGAGGGTVNETFNDSSTSFSNTPPPSTSSTVASGSGQRHGNATGSNLDLFAGYSFQPHLKKYVFAGQFEGSVFNDTTMKASGTRAAQSMTTNRNGSTITSQTLGTNRSISENNTNLTSIFSFIGRAGYLIKPNVLLYALVGGAEGHFSNFDPIFTSSSGVAGTNITSNTGNLRNEWKLGLAAGAGGEYRVTEHWSILAEYRYLHFGFNRDGSLSSSNTAVNASINNMSSSSSTQHTHTDLNFNLGQIGVVYRI